MQIVAFWGSDGVANTVISPGGAALGVPLQRGMMLALRSAVVVFVISAGYCVSAQQASLVEAPSDNLVRSPRVVSFGNPESHRFFDRQNAIAFTSLAGLIAVDAVTTQYVIATGQGHEANPVWRPLVQRGWPGEMAASALGFSAALGMSYTLHKTGHHKMERWTNWLVVGVEAGVDGHNLMLASQK